MSLDPRLPVIVGVSQVTQRGVDITDAREPIALMTDAVRAAAADAEAPRLLSLLDLIVVVRGAWSYSDPGRLLADALGAVRARTAMTAEGGNSPQHAINQVADRIAAGQIRAAVVVGGEGIYSRRKARQLGIERPVTRQRDRAPDEAFGLDYPMSSESEQARGLTAPIHFYALFENAIRAEANESIGDHRSRIAQLLAGFSQVAAENPHAWSRDRLTDSQIRDESPTNPMVMFPYTKLMCSNWFTDQSAAVLLCSAELAGELAVPSEQWVFPHSGAAGNDTRHVSNRASLTRSPAIRVAGRRALQLADTEIDEVEHVDVYSCFPSAVQVAATELRLAATRPLTITGGLSYFGGPLSNYVTHSVATMVDVLRRHPGERGLITANGGYLTKHAFGVYSTHPPRAGYRSADVQAEIDSFDTVRAADAYIGRGQIESSTVAYSGGQPQRALVSVRTGDGARLFANSSDADLIHAATHSELSGTEVDIDSEGTARLA